MEESKNWPQNITWWNKISVKTADLAISESETLLTETSKTAQVTQDRADKLVTILVPLISALFIFVISKPYINRYIDIVSIVVTYNNADIFRVFVF